MVVRDYPNTVALLDHYPIAWIYMDSGLWVKCGHDQA